jgi:hypothetical protein
MINNMTNIIPNITINNKTNFNIINNSTNPNLPNFNIPK